MRLWLTAHPRRPEALVGPNEVGKGDAVPVVRDVIAHRVALGAATLDHLGADALAVRRGADEPDTVGRRAAAGAVLSEQEQDLAAARVDLDAVGHLAADVLL